MSIEELSTQDALKRIKASKQSGQHPFVAYLACSTAEKLIAFLPGGSSTQLLGRMEGSERVISRTTKLARAMIA